MSKEDYRSWSWRKGKLFLAPIEKSVLVKFCIYSAHDVLFLLFVLSNQHFVTNFKFNFVLCVIQSYKGWQKSCWNMFVNFKSVDHFLKLIIIPFHANSRVTNIKGKLQISLLVRKASRKRFLRNERKNSRLTYISEANHASHWFINSRITLAFL